ncbi:hypothetical protein GTP46_06605 [Duganella sp. FT135W]|uniref:Uncharacterized protein n=1 Tax=Duganella flavida TaxID=2692175 RepID=A0A6L8K7X6_9BURK|nr:hypothetical protein [Duganella flavida]MYM22308.1 hypothetical protein [Duganella flavida]
MADMNREEADAKIGASEARTDSKFATVLARFDALTAAVREMKAEMRNIKMTVILTGVSTGLAVIFGVAGFNASLLNNMLASYDSRKERGQWQSEIRKQSIETELALTRIRKQLDTIDARQAQMSAEFEKIKQERASGRK